MKMSPIQDKISVLLDKEEALVLFEMLERLVEEREKELLPLLESSAEFAVLCRLASHLEQHLKEPLSDDYETLLTKARALIIKQSGRYPGLEEK